MHWPFLHFCSCMLPSLKGLLSYISGKLNSRCGFCSFTHKIQSCLLKWTHTCNYFSLYIDCLLNSGSAHVFYNQLSRKLCSPNWLYLKKKVTIHVFKKYGLSLIIPDLLNQILKEKCLKSGFLSNNQLSSMLTNYKFICI